MNLKQLWLKDKKMLRLHKNKVNLLNKYISVIASPIMRKVFVRNQVKAVKMKMTINNLARMVVLFL